jgi:hypothetical protein
MREGSLEVPFDPRRRIKRDINRVKKARPAAEDINSDSHYDTY